MKNTRNNKGGGFIDDLSRLKAKAILKPLKYYIEYNKRVNACNSLKELKTLINNNK